MFVPICGAVHAASDVGWVLANKPTATAYTPDPSYSYNSQGGHIIVRRTGTGSYQVAFAKLHRMQPDTVQVSAFRTSGSCASAGWQPDADAPQNLVASVSCYDAAGNPADTAFSLLYEARSGTAASTRRGIAFLFADQPSATTYTPGATYQYNSSGGSNTISRLGIGEYDVFIPNFETGGTAAITAYDATAWCGTVPVLASSGVHIGVDCVDSSGQEADEFFTMLYARQEAAAQTAKVQGAYAFAEEPEQTASYRTPKAASYNGLGHGAPTAQKLDTGRYVVKFPGASEHQTSTAQVTGANPGNHCNLLGWSKGSVTVGCYAFGSGAPADDRFAVMLEAVD